jgi:hypothetical protein
MCHAYALSWVGQLEVEAGWLAGSWVLAVAACFLWWQMIPGDGFPIAACRQEEEGKWGVRRCGDRWEYSKKFTRLDKQKQREKIVLSCCTFA